MRALIFCLLLACSCPADPPAAEDAGSTTRAAEPDAPLEYTDPPRPCSRTTVLVVDGGPTWAIPLPCRPYDRFRDTPDPQP